MLTIRRIIVALCLLAVATSGAAFAQRAPERSGALSSLVLMDERFQVRADAVLLSSVQSQVESDVANGWVAFQLGQSGSWQGYVDPRNGRLTFAEGSGIPWIPGRGNKLTQNDISGFLNGATKPNLITMDAIARDFLPRVTSLMGLEGYQLRINKSASGQPSDYLWFVEYEVLKDGKKIDNARVIFRVNHGNLIQFGTEFLPPSSSVLPVVTIDKEGARNAVASYIGGFGQDDKLVNSGTLHYVPALNGADSYDFANGRGILAVWDVAFNRKGVMGTWQGRVDASTGRVVDFRDINDYGQVTGGVYPESPTVSPEVVRAMPYANVATGVFANSAGLFSGTTGTTTLNGQYVAISDTCGAISKSADAAGNIALGTSGGTDCTIPATGGGAGNTHSSRTQFYHVNRIKEVGRAWLPSNAWLAAKLTVNVNLNQTCNAYWNGSSLNFFKSGGGCGNTGEIAAVSLHEYGHGLDQNDGTGTAPEGGTGEAYGDFTAALALHNSCIGPGFLTTNCGGYGNACTACTGVRDIDFAKHASAVAATVANHTQVRCGAGSGPCGKEVHCESYVPSEAVWDLAARDLPSPGTGSAWTITDRLWYLSRSTATSSFSCTTGATFTSNGCNAGSWWKTMRAADDDDGNLTNGTPHSCNLFAAFNRHGIACTTDAGANTCFNGCTPSAAPTLTLTAGDNSVGVSVSGTGVFDVFRNEVGCNAGFTKIANDSAGTFTDSGVANGTTYFYQAVAQPTGNEACASAPSACLSVTPTSGPCTPPAAPTGLTATGGTNQVSLSWTASSGATEYHILRSTTSGGPYTQVGTSATTSFTDTGLACGTTYFYVVRAANSGTCESGNSAQASATTATCPICTNTTLYNHNFDAASGLDGFTRGTFVAGGTTTTWRGVQTCTAASGTRIFRYGGTTCTADYTNNNFNFAQPNGAGGITIPAGSTSSVLTFKHRRAFESGFDGGTLAISTDGTNYTFVPSSAIVAGGYTGTIAASCPPAGSAGASVWTGTSTAFTTTTVDLDAACNAIAGNVGGCAGKAVRIAFTSITDCSVTGDGWFLDDVAVSACVP